MHNTNIVCDDIIRARESVMHQLGDLHPKASFLIDKGLSVKRVRESMRMRED